MREQDILEVGMDAAWALWAENDREAHSAFGTWLLWHQCPRGKRMASLYGFGEILEV